MNLLRVSSVKSSRYSQWQQPSDEQINWKKMKKFYNSHYPIYLNRKDGQLKMIRLQYAHNMHAVCEFGSFPE